MIYNKKPIDVLWDMTKDLLGEIPIYKEVMHEDDNSTPDSYILLRSQLSDNNDVFGDGVGLIRAADNDILLISKGYADDSTDLHNVNKEKIRQHLKTQKVNFQEFNLGYDKDNNITQHTFTLKIDYIA